MTDMAYPTNRDDPRVDGPAGDRALRAFTEDVRFTKPPSALKGGVYARIGEPPLPDDIRRTQYKLQKHHNLTMSKDQLLHYTGKKCWADVRSLNSASIHWAWKQERKARQERLDRYVEALRASFAAYYEFRQNVAPPPLLTAGAIRKQPPIAFQRLLGSDRFKVGEWVNIPYGARAQIAAVRDEHIAVHVPGLEGRAVRGYRRQDIEAWNPAPELEATA